MKESAAIPSRSETVGTPAAPSALLQRKCACGGSAGLDDRCEGCRRQRLTGKRETLRGAALIGPAGGRHGEEADRAAEGPWTGAATRIQRETASAAPAAPAQAALNAPFYISFTHVAPPAAPDHTQANPGPSGGDADRAGYTRVRLRRRLTVAWSSGSPRGEGAARTVPVHARSANVLFRLDPVEVFVSSSYAEGSCPYRVTRRHEYEHVRAFLRIFREHRAEMVDEANAIALPTASAPAEVPADRVDAEQDRIVQPVVAAINRVRSRLVTAMNDDRAEKDSAASYARVYAQCPREDW